jgi:hypothetical protein
MRRTRVDNVMASSIREVNPNWLKRISLQK